MSLKGKIYTLNVAKWRCGGYSEENQLGQGFTEMVNKQGYSCCLGQFASRKVPKKNLLEMSTPADVAHSAGTLYDTAFVSADPYGHYSSTSLACTLMEINDDQETTPEEKITEIRKLLKTCGFQLRVINRDLLTNMQE